MRLHEKSVRALVREMILQEDERIRQGNANLSAHIATKVKEPTDRRMFGRVLKDAWRKEADHASFRNVTFIHWQSAFNIANLVRKPMGKDEISTMPYVRTPWKPFSLGWSNVIGAILKGHPTLIANADLNSNAFRRAASTMRGSVEKMDHRQKSSGWNKYPGPKSPGSEPEFTDSFTDELARSWEDHLVYSADEIAPAEKINFNAATVFSPSSREPGDKVMGWPEALIDNWKVVGLVIPDKLIGEWGIDETLDNLRRHEVPSGIPIFDESGEERSMTR
jgi:hypothetical protein